MITTSSTQSLALAIADLSQKLSEIASLMNQDAAETAVSAPATKQTAPAENPQQEVQKSQTEQKPQSKSAAPTPEASPSPSGTESSTADDAEYTIEQVRAVLAEKSQAGLTGEVKKLLGTFGAAKLSAVKPSDYGKLITAAKALG